MQLINFQREIPIRHVVDVLVVGGGPAGVAAAVTASRQGASVILVEKLDCLGGMGTAGLVPVYMKFSDGENILAGGVGEEILDRLHEAGGSYPDNGMSIKSEVLKRVYDDMVIEANIQLYLQTTLVAVEQQHGCVTEAVFHGKTGLFAIQAGVFIDCTGDGDLAAWADAPYEKGDPNGNMMAATLCSLWAGIDWDTVTQSPLGKGNARIEEAIRDGIISQDDRHLPGMWRVGINTGGGNMGHCFGADGTDERSVTEALVKGRKLILEYERYYKEYLKGFESMELMSTASTLGVRETRRITGEYQLNLDDFKQRASFTDEIGRYAAPVDIHAPAAGASDYQTYLQDFRTFRYSRGENYGIPYRSLIPLKLTNMLVAGRCISTDRYMQSSVRCMPGCYITGQAAGMAASLAVKQGGEVRSVDVNTLQAKLKAAGAFLPNYKQ